MSRSMGDTVAHQIGVVSTPDIINHKIKKEDKYIIIASDGLWEWFDNAAVARLIKDS